MRLPASSSTPRKGPSRRNNTTASPPRRRQAGGQTKKNGKISIKTKKGRALRRPSPFFTVGLLPRGSQREKSPPLPAQPPICSTPVSDPRRISARQSNAHDTSMLPLRAKAMVNLTLTEQHVGAGYKHL